LRREIVKNLEQQQEADAHVALKIRDEVLGTHKRVLNSFVRFLKASITDTTGHSQAIFRAVLSSNDFEEWLSLNRERADLLESTSAKKQSLDAAQTRYDEHSPFGPVSRLFSDESEKRVSFALKEERDARAADLEELKSSLAAVQIRIKRKARDFMVHASSADKLTLIVTMPSVIQSDLAAILSESKERMDEVWRGHSELQLSALLNVTGCVDSLSRIYKISTS
jgi:hypothetical protein